MNDAFRVFWKERARNELKSITHKLALNIEDKIITYLAQSPKELGRPLTGNHKGLYRYRYGDYRILYEIDAENNLIIINRVGHRSSIY